MGSYKFACVAVKVCPPVYKLERPRAGHCLALFDITVILAEVVTSGLLELLGDHFYYY